MVIGFFFKSVSISGVGYKKDNIAKAFSGKTVTLYCQPEPTNKHDKLAIKVIAERKGWFFTKRYHIGYIPKEIAQKISKSNLSDRILPRLKETWIGDHGGLKIYIDILGFKTDFHQLK